MKVLLSALPKDVITLACINDIICFSRSEVRLRSHVSDMTKHFTEAGFYINYDKSELLPSRRTKFLGMIID